MKRRKASGPEIIPDEAVKVDLDTSTAWSILEDVGASRNTNWMERRVSREAPRDRKYARMSELQRDNAPISTRKSPQLKLITRIVQKTAEKQRIGKYPSGQLNPLSYVDLQDRPKNKDKVNTHTHTPSKHSLVLWPNWCWTNICMARYWLVSMGIW